MTSPHSQTEKKRPRVVVGMSGGVDSSVAAALLVEQGYEVIGVMMKYWSEGVIKGEDNKCCSIESQQEALKIAKKIGIPFHVLDLSVQFKQLIVNDFLEQKRSGFTPNPCVNCNKNIKFGLFLLKARELFDADFIATGHYAAISHDAGDLVVAMGEDQKKDQSYFLCQVPRHVFKRVLFPLANLTKPEVRVIAEKLDLPVAHKKDSHEICFFTEANPKQFLQRHFDLVPGDVVTSDGKKVGRHEGALLYTKGQRKGLNLGIEDKVYVTEINTKTNTVVVTKDQTDPRISSRALHVERLNLLVDELPAEAQIRIRHLGKFFPAQITADASDRTRAVITFAEPVVAVQPGQFAALYRDKQLLGGGYIAETA